MKKLIIQNYIQGLASFLDEQNIKWEQSNIDEITIYYHNDYDLFRIGFDFGKFYIQVQHI